MKTTKLEFFYNKEKYKIKRTNHLYEKRGASEYQRDAFIDDTRFVKIFKEAIISGLKSFREKGPVVVNVPTYNSKYYSILCVLDSRNTITVITVLHTNKFWKTFSKIHNKINMVYKYQSEVYKVPRMNEKEKGFKELDSICYKVKQSNEDLTFKSVMDNFLDLKF